MQLLTDNLLDYQHNGKILSISDVVFPDKPEQLPPRNMPRRSFETAAGKAAFFHALAHIEFVAIYLAWDIIYRFRDLPIEFYQQWLRIADEEAQHFSLIRNHLLSLGIDYGDLPAHSGLWTHAVETCDDVLDRLAIIPRFMEARGLDVTPVMIDKLDSMSDKHGVEILTRIYQDEIGHVECGSYWFKLIAAQRGLDSEQLYKNIIAKHFKSKPKGPFNRGVRIIAGFTTHEIDWLEEGIYE